MDQRVVDHEGGGRSGSLTAGGADVVDFSAGEPDFPTPENIKQAAVEVGVDEGTFSRWEGGCCGSRPSKQKLKRFFELPWP